MAESGVIEIVFQIAQRPGGESRVVHNMERVV